MPPSDRPDRAPPHHDDQVESRCPKITKSRSPARSRRLPLQGQLATRDLPSLHTKMIPKGVLFLPVHPPIAPIPPTDPSAARSPKASHHSKDPGPLPPAHDHSLQACQHLAVPDADLHTVTSSSRKLRYQKISKIEPSIIQLNRSSSSYHRGPSSHQSSKRNARGALTPIFENPDHPGPPVSPPSTP